MKSNTANTIDSIMFMMLIISYILPNEQYSRIGLGECLFIYRENVNVWLGLEMYQMVWTPKVTVYTRKTNKKKISDEGFSVYERMMTFEGPDVYSETRIFFHFFIFSIFHFFNFYLFFYT